MRPCVLHNRRRCPVCWDGWGPGAALPDPPAWLPAVSAPPMNGLLSGVFLFGSDYHGGPRDVTP